MKHLSPRFAILAVLLIIINIIGLLWIHHDLTRRPEATVLLSQGFLSPDSTMPDRIRLVFDRNLIDKESVGQVESGNLFAMTPSYPGRWKWSAPKTLDYLFDEPVPLGRRLKLEITEQFKARTGMKLEGTESIDFQTDPLELIHCHTMAADPDSVTVELAFNQPVDPGEVLRHVRFFDEATPGRTELREITCLTAAAEKEIVLRIPRPSSDQLEIILDRQLKGAGADLTLEYTVTRRLKFSSRFSYLSARVNVSQFNDTASVRLRFSDRLNRQQQLPEIVIDPEVPEFKAHRSSQDLVLNGKFLPEHRYTITLPANLMSRKDQTLRSEQAVTVDIPARRAGLSFAHSRGILSPHGSRIIDMKAVNISEIQFSTWRVYDNNLVSHLQGHRKYQTSRAVPSKKISLDTPRNEVADLAVELIDLIQPGPGIYAISANATDQRWSRDNILVALTDLAITAKRHKSGALVWVTSLSTGQPVSRATVKALTYNNQTLVTAVTDEQGLAVLNYVNQTPDGPMWVIAARKENDLSYLRPDENQWVIDNVDHIGRDYPDDLDAMLYTERGVYRPGDTIHLTGLLRRRDGQIPPAFPISVMVRRPDGKEVADLLIHPDPNAQGMFHVDVPTTLESQTGRYSFHASLGGSKTSLGWTSTFVETFLPLRMTADAHATAERFEPNDPPEIAVTARYLWDQPAAGIPVQVTATLQPIRFHSQTYPDYVFGKSLKTGSVELKTVKGQLDENGKTTLQLILPDTLASPLYKVHMTATITEPGSRSVSANTTTILDAWDRHIGLKSASGKVVTLGESVEVSWVTVKGNNEPSAPDQLEVSLLTVEYENFLKEVNKRRIWKSIEKLNEIHTLDLQPQNDWKGSFPITCPDAGRYRLIVREKQSNAETHLDLYASKRGARPTLALDLPERLEIVTDQDIYTPGQTVNTIIRSPISGMLLFTLETDTIIHHEIVELKGSTIDLAVPLPKNLRGGAFLTASVVQGIDTSQKKWLPHRAMGMKRIQLDHKQKLLPIDIQLPAQVRPLQKVEVTVTTDKPIDPNHPPMVHVWAVDEGILLPTAYQVPSPYDFFLCPRRLAVFTSDLFYRLLPDFARPETTTRIGAGERFAVGALRRNPVAVRYRRPDVVWQTAKPVDPEGVLKLQMQLPELIGQMRIMAVAVDHDRYGTNSKNVILTSDLIIESGWPRFASPQDVFQVPVKFFNSTTKPITTKLKAQVSGPIQLKNLPSDPLTIPPNQSITLMLDVEAQALGSVDIQIQALPGDDASKPYLARTRASFPVRPAAVPHSETALMILEAGQEIRIPLSDSFVEGTQQLTVNLSARPDVQLAPALEKLISYPYGCAEQTTSKLFALLYAPKIMGETREDIIRDMVHSGIIRLWSMQTQSGGLSYWPGGTQPNTWASAYVAWCLLEAKNAGYEIDPRFTEDLMKYVQSQLIRSDDNSVSINTKALLCHVLSTFGQPPVGWMNSLADQKNKLDLAALAHLAGAFHAAGQRDKALALIPKDALDFTVSTTTRGRLTSTLQQDTVLLSVLLQIDPEFDLIDPLAAKVSKARKNGCWRSTLENAAAIVALSRYQVQSAEKDIDFNGTVRWAEGKSIPFSHAETVTQLIASQTSPVTITSQGQGKIYLALSSEGLAREGLVKPYNRRLVVERFWQDRAGDPVDPNELQVGDLVNVVIELSTPDDRTIHNIAIVDALPGGMEVENPRLVTSASRFNRRRGNRPDHLEFLDDRVVLFCSANTRTKAFRYSLRVTTAGQFTVPPIQASCMYDPAVASLGAKGTVIIKP
jgi:alpha-2-macroglobulin